MDIRRFIIFPIQIVLAILICSGCSRTDAPPKKLEPLRISMGGILAPLPFIAKEKGFFREEGISAEISLLGDGKAAMNGFLEGKYDAVVCGPLPVVAQSFYRNDFVIIASVATSDNAVKILARRDRGIATLKDLQGKRIGVSKGIISEFFLDQFLSKNRIPRNALTIVDVSHQKMPAALANGEIDAFAASDVAYLKARQLIGNSGVTIAEPGLTNFAACLVVKKALLAANAGFVRRMVAALGKAEQELARNPEAIVAMLSKNLAINAAELTEVISNQENRLLLDQVLLLSLEEEARWMREKEIGTGKPLPNFLQVIDPEILRSVNPGAVRLK